ncbi:MULTISPECIES: amidohydrolase family protein [Streptomyces]|uniref:amidohydrolase family protein n=1 Tax=Streptomyces TaxID=1883 RepID=UPI0006EBD979|nr:MULTISPECIES: amidohydrolase family protein [Streptomyces]MCF3122480.1 amidohydrolase [Streptomyces arenae]
MTPEPEAAPAAPSIVDAQVNLASLLAIPRSFVEHQAANVHHRLDAYGVAGRPDRVRNQVFSLYADDDGDQLVAEMDEAGIDQAFLVAPDYSHAADCALTQPELAALHDRVNRRHPGRFHVFWGVDPRGGQDGLDLFERCVTEYGFAGMKLYPPCGYEPGDPRLYPYFERCAHYGIPVLTHTGPGWGPLDFTYGSPLLVDRAARDFPGVDFILGHGGVTHVDEATYLCAHRPNVHLDISQFHSVLSADGWQTHLNRLFRAGISHKILFGTCWPSFRLSESLGGLVKEFSRGAPAVAGLREAERKMIMSGNSLRLLGRKPAEQRGGRP